MVAVTKKVDPWAWPTLNVAGRLGLAATPTFALMAVISDVGAPGMSICAAEPAFLPVSDMALMYLLMSFFHLSPWLKLLSARSQRRNTTVTQTEGD